MAMRRAEALPAHAPEPDNLGMDGPDGRGVDAMSDGATYLAYMLAHTRRGPYYFGTATDVEAIEVLVCTLMGQRSQPSGRDFDDPALPVWLETHASKAIAGRRVAQIRRWPLRWQRRLIESVNPDWFDQCDALRGIAREFSRTVPETVPTKPLFLLRHPFDHPEGR